MPQSVVYHVGGGTLGYENPRKTYLNFRNNLLMLYKNLPSGYRRIVMCVRFFMDYLAALQMLLTKQLPNAISVFKARVAYHKMKKLYVQNTVRPINELPIAQRSIVFDFYLLRKKK
jgi:hypothetical protein